MDTSPNGTLSKVHAQPSRSLGESETDSAFCIRLLPQVSRTFALSIEALPDGLREPVRAAYLLCRIVDTIEDAAEVSQPLREALFDNFDAAMRDDEAPTAELETLARELHTAAAPDLELTNAASRVFRVWRALPLAQRDDIRGPVLEMSQGMRQYSRRQAQAPDNRLRIHNLDDLEEYCYYVAGTVGKLLTALFLRDCPQPPELARELRLRQVPFGLGLQLVNIVKDVADDAERGVTFLPDALLRDHTLEPADLIDPARRTSAMQVLQAVAARARTHLDAAFEYASLWPAQSAAHIRLFTIVPLLLADGSLRLVEAAGPDVLSRGRNPKVGKNFVNWVLQNARSAATDQTAFERLRGDVVSGAISPES